MVVHGDYFCESKKTADVLLADMLLIMHPNFRGANCAVRLSYQLVKT